jgi:calcineurin-like phosphoesterase family protein
MSNVWFISDTHFGHANILKFEYDGKPLREFNDTHHMDTVMCERWCEVVKPEDKIYHLGDVSFTDGGLERLRKLPGKKRLVLGNHDKHKYKHYSQIFEAVYGVRQINRFWMTHVPMHPQSIDAYRINIHGHLHRNKVRDENGWEDVRYFNVCVENHDYYPVNFDTIVQYANKVGR